MANPTFIEVQKFLAGVDYPAEKETLLQHAADRDAPEEILDALKSIDERTYDGPNEVSEQVASEGR
jgi:hypothetical protein